MKLIHYWSLIFVVALPLAVFSNGLDDNFYLNTTQCSLNRYQSSKFVENEVCSIQETKIRPPVSPLQQGPPSLYDLLKNNFNCHDGECPQLDDDALEDIMEYIWARNRNYYNTIGMLAKHQQERKDDDVENLFDRDTMATRDVDDFFAEPSFSSSFLMQLSIITDDNTESLINFIIGEVLIVFLKCMIACVVLLVLVYIVILSLYSHVRTGIFDSNLQPKQSKVAIVPIQLDMLGGFMMKTPSLESDDTPLFLTEHDLKMNTNNILNAVAHDPNSPSSMKGVYVPYSVNFDEEGYLPTPTYPRQAHYEYTIRQTSLKVKNQVLKFGTKSHPSRVECAISTGKAHFGASMAHFIQGILSIFVILMCKEKYISSKIVKPKKVVFCRNAGSPENSGK